MTSTPDSPETYWMTQQTPDECTAVDWTEAFSRKQQIIREFSAAALHDDGGPETDRITTLWQERRQSAAAGRRAPDRTVQRPAHGHDQGTAQPPRHRPGP
ncbi:hypothetical protein ACWZEH_00330 [Streptomyces sp. QTS137]